MSESIRRAMCRWFGHKPFIAEGGWKKGDHWRMKVKERPVFCPRCMAGFIEWTTNLEVTD